MSYASLKTLKPFFTNQCGRLLAGGKIYTYEAGTLTPKATYKDAAGLTENTNPIVLDVSGEADIYINSDYRFQIFDRDGVLINDVDSVAPTQRISSAFLIDESGFTQAQINATKEDTLNKGVAGGYPSLNEDTKIPTSQQYEASTTQKGIVQLVNDLTTGGVDKAVTAEQVKVLAGRDLGIGVTPQDVTASRVQNTLYTNTGTRPRVINIAALMTAAYTRFFIEIDGVKKFEASPSPAANQLSYSFFIVPPGSTYKVVGTAWSSLLFWGEM